MEKSKQLSVGFLDVLFITLLGFVSILIIVMWQWAIEQSKTNIRAAAEFVITTTWPISHQNDIDSWLLDPTGGIVWFRQKECNLSHLDRDDLGSQNDQFYLPNGEAVRFDYNQEITTIRSIIPGEWIFNIHYYRHVVEQPTETPVTIRCDKLNPSVQPVFVREINLTEQWQEVTVARFEMNREGQVVRLDYGPQEDIVKEILIENHHYAPTGDAL